MPPLWALSGEAERNQPMGDGYLLQWRARGRPRKELGVTETGCGVSPMAGASSWGPKSLGAVCFLFQAHVRGSGDNLRKQPPSWSKDSYSSQPGDIHPCEHTPFLLRAAAHASSSHTHTLTRVHTHAHTHTNSQDSLSEKADLGGGALISALADRDRGALGQVERPVSFLSSSQWRSQSQALPAKMPEGSSESSAPGSSAAGPPGKGGHALFLITSSSSSGTSGALRCRN